VCQTYTGGRLEVCMGSSAASSSPGCSCPLRAAEMLRGSFRLASHSLDERHFTTPPIQHSLAGHCQLLLRYGTRTGLCSAATRSLVHLLPMSTHNGLFDTATTRAKRDLLFHRYATLPYISTMYLNPNSRIQNSSRAAAPKPRTLRVDQPILPPLPLHLSPPALPPPQQRKLNSSPDTPSPRRPL